MKGRVPVVLALVGVLLASAGWAPVSASPSPTDDRRALVVGISKHAGKTKGTVGGKGDAEAFRTALLKADFQPANIRVLTDNAATANGIREGLDWLASARGTNGFSVFHYSGHVVQRGGDRDRDGEKLDEYLMTYNSRQLISDRELSERLQRVRTKLWVDIAGCEAAGFDEGGLSNADRLVTASSKESEKSYERPDWRKSVFTGLMIDQGMLEGRADSNRDSAVSIQEAFRYAAALAPQMTARQKKGAQHPQMAGGDGKEWFLRAPAPPPPAQPQPRRGRVCIVACIG